MRMFRALGVLTVCHFVATISLLAGTFASGMARFDSGEPAGLIERGASQVLSIFSLPLLRRMFRGDGPVPWYFDGLLGYIAVALNSLLWATAILGCVWLWRRYRVRGGGRPAAKVGV
jgi:hypothetical protein